MRVLVAGSEVSELNTAAAALMAAGCQVTTSTTLCEIEQYAKSGDHDLALALVSSGCKELDAVLATKLPAAVLSAALPDKALLDDYIKRGIVDLFVGNLSADAAHLAQLLQRASKKQLRKGAAMYVRGHVKRMAAMPLSLVPSAANVASPDTVSCGTHMLASSDSDDTLIHTGPGLWGDYSRQDSVNQWDSMSDSDLLLMGPETDCFGSLFDGLDMQTTTDTSVVGCKRDFDSCLTSCTTALDVGSPSSKRVRGSATSLGTDGAITLPQVAGHLQKYTPKDAAKQLTPGPGLSTRPKRAAALKQQQLQEASKVAIKPAKVATSALAPSVMPTVAASCVQPAPGPAAGCWQQGPGMVQPMLVQPMWQPMQVVPACMVPVDMSCFPSSCATVEANLKMQLERGISDVLQAHSKGAQAKPLGLKLDLASVMTILT